MNVRFPCPVCEAQVRVDLPKASGVDVTGLAREWRCPGCDHLGHLQAAPASTALSQCAACGNHELYRRKDFPHWLGLTILTGACLASVIPYWLYMPWLTWTILIGSAALDGLLYLAVGDVVVCYRCDAHHRGFVANPDQAAFELTIHERYRQERIRRELTAQGGMQRPLV